MSLEREGKAIEMQNIDKRKIGFIFNQYICHNAAEVKTLFKQRSCTTQTGDK